MGTFAAGNILDHRTGRPAAAQVLKASDFLTGQPLTPDDGPVVTGARGGYARFTITDRDQVTLTAADGTPHDLYSLEHHRAVLALAGHRVLQQDADGVFYPATVGAGSYGLEVDDDGVLYPVALPSFIGGM